MFTEVMITNALSPLRTLEALRGLVVPGGTVAVMSSEQGSISRNTEVATSSTRPARPRSIS